MAKNTRKNNENNTLLDPIGSHTRRYVPSCNDLRRSRIRTEGGLESPLVQLGVNLGRGDALMPQSNLNKPDVTCLVVEPCAKGMPQTIFRDGLCDPSFEAPSGDDPLDLAAGQSVAGSGSKQRMCQFCVTGRDTQLVEDDTCHQNSLWLSTFWVSKRHHASVPVDVAHIQGDGLCESASSREHEQDDHAITFGPPACEREREKRFDLILGQHLRR